MEPITVRQSFKGTELLYNIYTPRSAVKRRVAFIGSPITRPESWQELCSLLVGQGVLCVTIELPGFGGSAPAAPQSNVTRAKLFWGVLDEVEIRRFEGECAWHLVTHGSAFGAAMEMKRMYPESVLSCTFLSPVAFAFSSDIKQLTVQTGAGKWLLRKYYERFKKKERFVKKLAALYGSAPSQEAVAELYNVFFVEGRFESLMQLALSGYRLRKNTYACLKQVMIVWGKNDRLFGDDIPKKLRQRLEAIDMQYVNAGHMVMETNPDWVRDWLVGWFDNMEGVTRQPERKR